MQFRNRFANGEYVPIGSTGEKSRHVCAFARDRKVVVVAPRLICGLPGGKQIAPTGAIWGDTALETDTKGFENVFTGERVASNWLADILKTFPIALLART